MHWGVTDRVTELLLSRVQDKYFTLKHFSNPTNYPTIMMSTSGRLLKCGGLCEQAIGYFDEQTNTYGIYTDCVRSVDRQQVRNFDGSTQLLCSETDDVSVHIQEVLNVLTKVGFMFVRRSGALAPERVPVPYDDTLDQLVPLLPSDMSIATEHVHMADFYDDKLEKERTTLVLPLDQVMFRLNAMLKIVDTANALGRVRGADVEFYKKHGSMLQWLQRKNNQPAGNGAVVEN